MTMQRFRATYEDGMQIVEAKDIFAAMDILARDRKIALKRGLIYRTPIKVELI